MEQLPPLDEFGRELTQRVYDPSLWWVAALVDGHLKGEWAESIRAALGPVTPETQRAIQLLVPHIIEQVVFKTLFLLDEEETELKVNGDVVSYERGELAGWLFNDDGWIARFSQHKQQEQG